MLRIGKNPKDQEDNDHSNHKPEVPDYSTAKTYTPIREQVLKQNRRPNPRRSRLAR